MTIVLYIRCRAQGHAAMCYTTDNGLPQNSVKDITQDRYGYIWISTENGILRYDGRRFLQWPGIPLNNLHFKSFYGSREKDSILIRNEYEKDRLMIRGREPVKIKPATEAASEGTLLAGQYYWYFRRSTLNEPMVRSHYMMTTSRGRLLFSRQGIRLLPKDSGAEIRLRSSFDVSQMASTFVAGRCVFLADYSSGQVINLSVRDSSPKYHALLKGKDVSVYFSQLNGQAFLMHGDTVYLMEEHAGQLTFRKLFHHPGIRAHRVFCAYYDEASGILYLGSIYKGLMVLRPNLFVCSKTDNPDELPSFRSFLPFPGGKVVDQSGRIFSPAGLAGNFNFDPTNSKDGMSYDDHGNILCYRSNIVARYGPPPVFQKFRIQMPSTEKVIYIFKSDGQWFICNGRNEVYTLTQYNDDSFRRPVRTYRLSGKPYCMRRYGAGTILLGCMNGLYLLDHLKGRKVLLSREVNVKNIERTRDGNFWFLTVANGIYLFRNKQLIRMPLDDAGHLKAAHYMLEDKRGYLWISTNNGLYRVRRKMLLSYAQDPSVPVHYYRYSTRDGLNTNEFNGIGRPGATLLDNGSFAFPSMDGVVFFEPNRTKALYPLPASLTVSRITVGGKTTIFRNRFCLPNDFYRAEVHVDAAYYGNSDNLIMEARLDGDGGRGWQRLGEDGIYTIERIEPGEHMLQVRMLKNDLGTYESRSISFRIEPLFYQTRWFRILLSFLILGTTAMLIRVWTRNLREKLRTQKAISTAIEERLSLESGYHEDLLHAVTHDVATPIKHLSNLSRLMLETTDPELRSKYFESIYRSTEDLYNHTLELREYRSAFYEDTVTSRPYALHDLVETKLLLFGEMARYGGVRIINDVPEALHIFVNRSIMSIITQNLIDNALKNTRDGTVAVSAQISENTLAITVSDSGTGMSPQLRAYYNGLAKAAENEGESISRSGIGLQLSIRLARKLNAQLVFANNSPKGTMITLKLDLNYVQKNTDSR